jgi:hypothetical protein
MKRLWLMPLLSLALISCGYDGNFRYPCQDPINWDDPNCQPPICEADGTCTKDLIPPEALTP